MPLNAAFPIDPYVVLDPEIRWYPGGQDEQFTEDGNARLLPPLVYKIRHGVKAWRDAGYAGASDTTRALLNYWFKTEHPLLQSDGTMRPFRYFFAQREAVESAIWLYEVEQARDPYALIKYDGSGRVSGGMFAEDWTRYVMKMATGAGKTKVMSLLIAWSYFHRRYETGSDMSMNFLVIAPKLSQVRPFVLNEKPYLVAANTVFNKVVGDNAFELELAGLLTGSKEIVSFLKNPAQNPGAFKIEYRTADGRIATYYPDFIVKQTDKDIWVIETKGREDLDDPPKWERLKQWCADATARDGVRSFRAMFVRQEEWEQYRPKTFAALAATFADKAV